MLEINVRKSFVVTPQILSREVTAGPDKGQLMLDFQYAVHIIFRMSVLMFAEGIQMHQVVGNCRAWVGRFQGHHFIPLERTLGVTGNFCSQDRVCEPPYVHTENAIFAITCHGLYVR